MFYSYLGALLLGLSKAGIKGPGVAIVGLVAWDFGAKASTGLLLPLLIFADILAVSYYHSHANWKLLKQFLPLMLIGVIVAAVVGHLINDRVFKFWMAGIVFVSLCLLILRDFKWKDKVPTSRWYSNLMGFLAGFTSMIGNLAGPFANIFFISKQTPKTEFIGTAAWMFLIINVFKLPFHIFMWDTIDNSTLALDLKLIPAVIVGLVLGVYFVKQLSEYWYKFIIYASTFLGIGLIYFS